MSRWLLDFAGLAKPYRFERTFLILFAVLLGLLAVAAVVHLLIAGELTRGTPRFGYFVYLAALLGVAVAAARLPKVGAVVLSLAALELGLGVGSNILQHQGYAPNDLLPENEASQASRKWHPLLQEVIRPGSVRRLWDGEVHFNAEGLRGPERSPDDLRGKTVVALFGGSTTEDVAVPDGHAWSERLEQILGRDRFAVVNRGSAGYSTVQLVLLTAFYQEAFGVKPDCAVYYTGGVDVQNSHIQDLDPGYVDYHTPALIDAEGVRRIDGMFPASPAFRYLGRLMMLAFDTAQPVPLPHGNVSELPDPNLEAIYARNIRTISAINRDRRIKTVWIGEVVDPVVLDREYGSDELWAPYVAGDDVWPLLSHLNAVMRREAAALGDVYIDIPVKKFTSEDFVDGEHFSVEGSRKFATLVAPKIAEACRS